MLGQQLGNYRLVKLLGSGGFAEVYLGQHIHVKSLQVAIKVLHARLGQNYQAGFLQEAETIARLRHAHIIRILDFGIESRESAPYLIMDYAPNGTVRNRHPSGSLVPLAIVAAYVEQIASALQSAHARNLVHRDLKPENLLVGESGEILLSDFGIAAIAHSTSSLDTSIYAGTAPYSAPEQIMGKPRRESDQYALGIIVYEWLSGKRPFQGTMQEIIFQHLGAPPPSLRERGSTTPPEVEAVIMRVLAKDPHQRFPSMQAFATAFEKACAAGSPTPSVEETEPAQTMPSSQVQQKPGDGEQPLQLGVVQPPEITHPEQPVPVVTPATGGDRSPLQSTTEIQPLQIRETLVPPPLPVVSSSSRASTPFGDLGATRRVTRRKVLIGLGVVAASLGIGGTAWWELSHGSFGSAVTTSSEPTPVPAQNNLYTYRGHSDVVEAVAWSPDGKRIASGSWDKTVQVWEATTGTPKLTYRGHSNYVATVAWSPNGQHIASGSWDHTVQVWKAVDGSRVYTYRGHTGIIANVLAVAWSPDGSLIASGSGDHTVQVWEATTGTPKLTYRGHSSTVYSVAWSPDGKFIASGDEDDHTVQVWNAVDGSHVYTYREHTTAPAFTVWAVAWSPDSQRIASAGGYYMVQVWEATTGTLKRTYQGHSGSVFSVAWSPDGTRIASGSVDQTVQVWKAI